MCYFSSISVISSRAVQGQHVEALPNEVRRLFGEEGIGRGEIRLFCWSKGVCVAVDFMFHRKKTINPFIHTICTYHKSRYQIYLYPTTYTSIQAIELRNYKDCFRQYQFLFFILLMCLSHRWPGQTYRSSTAWVGYYVMFPMPWTSILGSATWRTKWSRLHG